MPSHIFISYAREDQPYTRKLAEHLRQRGFDVWMDDRIDFGDRWWQTIVEALQASAAFVVVMAPESETSEWVHREVLLALRERKPIFPLLLRGRGFPILVDRQYADVTGGRMPPDDFCDRLRQVVPGVEVVRPPAPRREAKEMAEPEPEPSRAEGAIAATQPVEPEMVLIPAGDFLIGSDPTRDEYAQPNEQPQHTLHLPDYYIAKIPITNVQYDAFVQATGHVSTADRRGDPYNRRHPERPGTSFEHRLDHPVVQVSRYAAVLYCNWLAELTGRPYRLPSEAEWEKAARGIDARIYPWGDRWDLDRCNSGENDIDDTTPVSAYPGGASPYGLLDMAGNVWEWTCSLYRDYPYDPNDGREDLLAGDDVRRVLRGGAFIHGVWGVRCACRYGDDPSYGSRYYGFRLAASPDYLWNPETRRP